MRRYGVWTGHPEGHPENPEKCVAAVMQKWCSGQCYRRRDYGPNGLYCKQHANMIADGKRVYVPDDRRED